MNAFDLTYTGTDSMCVCVNCCASTLPFFSISNFEFNFLFLNFYKKKGIQCEEYFSSSKFSKLSEKLMKKKFFSYILIPQVFRKTNAKLMIFLLTYKKCLKALRFRKQS